MAAFERFSRVRARAEMPEQPLRRPRLWWLAVLGLFAIAGRDLVINDLLSEAHASQSGEMAANAAYVAGELVLVAIFWSLRIDVSLTGRAILTAFFSIPVMIGVIMNGLIGDLPAAYRWERIPAKLHALWLGHVFLWSVAVAAVLPLGLRIYDAVRSRTVRT
jgi:hypothetical protein